VSSYQGCRVDVLAPAGDEGRCRLRKARVSRQAGLDPGISEWDNPVPRKRDHPHQKVRLVRVIRCGGERGELKHLSSPWKRKQPRLP